MNCEICRFDNPAENHFCGNCGAQLMRVRLAAPTSAAPPFDEGERRHIVLMFADVVSSTQIASKLDPEEWREVLENYHSIASDVVRRFDGHVAKLLGDGVLVYFGWPVAHESDGERAARAAHEILERVTTSNQLASPGFPSLSIRIGIHLGEVVLSQSGEVYGDAVNLAARVQSVAHANSVVVTDPVFRSFKGRLPTARLPAQHLRGVESQVTLYRVLPPERVLERQPASVTSTAYVNRVRELAALLSRWKRAVNGENQFILVSGEAGIGKSRLVQEFRAKLEDVSFFSIDAGGSEIFAGTPLYPVARLFSRLLDTPYSVDPATHSKPLQRLLRRGGADPTESLPVILEFAGSARHLYPLSDRQEIGERRSLLFRSLTACFLGAARHKPTLLVLEDAHWFDPSTLELLERVIEASTGVRLMVLILARPEFRPPSPFASLIERLALERLGPAEIGEIVTSVLPAGTSNEELIETITGRASGIPLFAEELAQSIGAGIGRARQTIVPETLAASLNARLDQVGGAREIVQTAAVIGDEFSAELLGAVVGGPTNDLLPLLDRLVDMDVLTRRYEPAGWSFNFRHALLRDAAYSTLLRGRKRQLHGKVALTIATSFETMAAAQSEMMARHFALAGLSEKAAQAWHEAGLKASYRGAYREAQKDFQLALENVDKLEESFERALFKLSIETALHATLQVTDGYSAPRTVAATERLRMLSDKVGDVEHSIAQVYGRWASLSSAGRFREAADIADQFLTLAIKDDRPETMAFAHMIRMTSRYRLGDLLGAERHYLAGKSQFPLETFTRRPGAIGQLFGNASQVAWMLGHTTEARERMVLAIDLSAKTNSTYDSTFTNFMAAMLSVLMREPREASVYAQQSLDLSERHHYPQFSSTARVALGRAQAELHRSNEALELIGAGVAGMADTGATVAMTLYLAWQAEAQAFAGRLEEALATIDRAHAFNPEERFFLSELFRIRGELRALIGNRGDAEADMREAVMLAGSMRAPALGLRAAISLHRHLERIGQGGAPEMVRSMLSLMSDSDHSPDFNDATTILAQTNSGI